MSFETERRKIARGFVKQNTVKETTDLTNKIEQGDKPVASIRKIHVIPLIKRYNFTYDIINEPFNERVEMIYKGPKPGGAG
jgi:hypothetical protein